MKNRFIAVFGGLISAIVCVFLFDYLAETIFAVPQMEKSEDRAQMREFMHQIPTGFFIIMLCGWVVAAILGSFIAAKIAESDHYKRSMTVGVVFLVATIINLILIPHPIWVWILGVILILPAAVLGFRLSGKKRG